MNEVERPVVRSAALKPLHVKVVGVEGRWLIIEIRELGITTQVRRYRRPSRQVEAIDTAVREAVYVSLEWEMDDSAYR